MTKLRTVLSTICLDSFVFIIAVVLGASTASAADTSDSEPLKLSGDVRVRGELDSRDDAESDEKDGSRFRPRLRARISASYQTPVEGISVGIRLATNAGTPGNSPHQTMDLGSSGTNSIYLDRAFISYDLKALTEALEGMSLVFGKQAMPLWGQTEAFWDEDIQPEGAALRIAKGLGSAGKLTIAAGHFYLTNSSWDSDGPFQNDTLDVWQVRWNGAFGSISPTLAFSGLHTSDGGEPSNSDGTNTFGATAFYMGSIQLKATFGDAKVVAGFDYHTSTASADGLDPSAQNGWVGQLRAGYGRYELRLYQYAIGEASVPFWGTAVLAQDNFPNSNSTAPTGFTGQRVQLGAKLGKGVSMDARAYLMKGNDDNMLGFSEAAGRSITRYQLNLNAKF